MDKAQSKEASHAAHRTAHWADQLERTRLEKLRAAQRDTAQASVGRR